MDAFDQVQDQANSSQFTLGSVSGTRRSGVELTFVINAGVAVDINSLNAAMTSTGASGYAQVFYTKATAAGQVISIPIVTFVRWYFSNGSDGDSSDTFPVWAIFFTVFMVCTIVLAILVFWHRRRTVAALAAETCHRQVQRRVQGIRCQRAVSPEGNYCSWNPKSSVTCERYKRDLPTRRKDLVA